MLVLARTIQEEVELVLEGVEVGEVDQPSQEEKEEEKSNRAHSRSSSAFVMLSFLSSCCNRTLIVLVIAKSSIIPGFAMEHSIDFRDFRLSRICEG